MPGDGLSRTQIPRLGNDPLMSVLLVDDRDGRIVAELATAEEIQRIVEAWARDDGDIPDYLSLVELRSHHGALVGTDATIRVHSAGLGRT